MKHTFKKSEPAIGRAAARGPASEALVGHRAKQDFVFYHWNCIPEPQMIDFNPEHFDNDNDDDPEAA